MTLNKKKVFIILKLLLISVAGYYLYTKLDWKEITLYLNKISFINLFISFVFLNLSYVFSAYRLKGYLKFRNIKEKISKLLLLGYKCSFFSNFLPGGIGGEGFKLYSFINTYKLPSKTAIKLVFSDRGSGMLSLAFLVLLFLSFINIKLKIPQNLIILMSCVGLIINVILYRIITFKLLDETTNISFRSFFYSLLVQLCCGIAFIVILLDINPNIDIKSYMFAFFLSSVMIIIPVSVGGLGIREVTFYITSKYLYIDSELAITASIIFYIISLISSLFAIQGVIKVKDLN
ncbi:MAG: flippase-like domain-containing protein [Sphingobacteriia bacterium]|nr:flippase-like domain-containing protein [Sphingobacteriia bacterium]